MRTMGMVGLVVGLVGCGAATEAEAPPGPPTLGCVVTLADTSGGSCTFTAREGGEYWVEARGDAVPALEVTVCDAAGCKRVPRTFTPTLITSETFRPAAGAVTVKVAP